MVRFQKVEKTSETVCKLIRNSVAKLKNKKGRIEGRRSKGVPQGLLHDVLVKGVIKDLVKVVNKEARFPKEISRKPATTLTQTTTATPRLTSPKKSPKPKSWSSKRNLLRLDLQNPAEAENDAAVANGSLTSTAKSRVRSASPKQKRRIISNVAPERSRMRANNGTRRASKSPSTVKSSAVGTSPSTKKSLGTSRSPSGQGSPKRAKLPPSSNRSMTSASPNRSAKPALSPTPKTPLGLKAPPPRTTKTVLIKRRVHNGDLDGGTRKTAKRMRVGGMVQRGLSGTRAVAFVKRLKR